MPQQSGYTHAFAGFIQNLLAHGHEVHVLTPDVLPGQQHEPLQHPALKVFRYKPALNVWALGLFYEQYRQARKIADLNNQYHYRLIWVETGDAPLVPALLPRALRNKTVVRFHSTSDTEYLHIGAHKKYKLRRWFWRYFAGKRIYHVAATNAYHVQYACKKVLHHHPVTQHVVTNTVAVPTTAVNTTTTRKWVMLGRMDYEGYKQKGFDVLEQALPLVAADMAAAGVTLHVIGEGICRPQLEKASAAYSCIQVNSSLPHEQVTALLQTTDVVLLPSRYEGVSMFALEALAGANAVIFGNTGGLCEMVDGNGILVTPGSVTGLVAAIKQLLQTPDLTAFKKQSVLLAQSRFSTAVQYQQFKQVMLEVAHD